MPKPGRVVKWLLIINVIVFLVQVFVDRPGRLLWGPMTEWLGIKWDSWWQLWRYITFQFLHNPDRFWHILLNMLGLYILGSPLEAMLGPKKFLAFYLMCGVGGGLVYVIIGAMAGEPGWVPAIGASAGVFGLIVTGAVFFPHIQIIFLFFPIPIRLASLVMFAGMVVLILRKVSLAATGVEGAFGGAMSDVAHFGGALAAGMWVYLRMQKRPRLRHTKSNDGAWEKKMRQRRERQAEIDRILQKIHVEGLNSLSRAEKRLLRQATESQREDESKINQL